MNYVEKQFHGLLETVALFEDIAAVAAAPVNGGVISHAPLAQVSGTLFEDIFSRWQSESTKSAMELMVIANDISDLSNVGWLSSSTQEV